jgi:hypothetical protein
MLARLICAAGLLAAVACSAPSPSLPFLSPTSNRGPVDDMLDRRSQAFRSGAETAFLADLDRGQSALVQHERMVYDNLRQLKFSGFRYHQLFPPDIAKPIPLQDGKPVSVSVLLTYHLADVDTGDSEEGFEYTIVPRGGKPVITKIDINGLGSTGNNIPWDLLPLHAARSGNVTVAADGTVPDPAPLAAAMDVADQQVRQAWGSRPGAPGTLVFASADEKQAHHWFPAPLSASAESAAFVFPIQGVDQKHNTASGEYVGGRVVLKVGKTPPNLVNGVYRHELTHAISAPLVSPGGDAPLWAIEGFAAFVENPANRSILDPVRRLVQQARFAGQLPDNRTFYEPPGVSANYGLGLTVFKFVAEKWGAGRAGDLYVEAVSGHTLNQATTKVLAMSDTALLQQWAAYVRQLQ